MRTQPAHRDIVVTGGHWTLESRGGMFIACLLAGVLALAGGASQASAVTQGPMWHVASNAIPSTFSTSDNAKCEGLTGLTAGQVCDAYTVAITNVGNTASSGNITIKDTLPPGLVIAPAGLQRVEVHKFEPSGAPERGFVTCVEEAPGSNHAKCETEEPVAAGDVITMLVPVIVGPEATASLLNQVEVEGGGAPVAVTSAPTTEATSVDPAPTEFGIAGLSMSVFGPSTELELQAGGHPDSVVASIMVNSALGNGTATTYRYVAVQEPRTEIVDLPMGFVGNPLTAVRCPEVAMHESEENASRCPVGSRIGTVLVQKGEGSTTLVDLYNVEPERGYPAEFAFEFDEAIVYMRARVLPSSGGYVLSVSVPGVPRSATLKVLGVSLLFFGDPGEVDGTGRDESFFRDPTSCGGPLDARVEAESWVDPGVWRSAESPVFAANGLQGVTGCAALGFDPGLVVSPETSTTDTPSGFEVDLTVPQTPDVAGDLASSDLRDAEVTLPQGVAVSPGAADGLVGCQEFGGEGIDLGASDRLAGENLVQEGEEEGVDGLVHPARGHCPLASQVGEVEVRTPLLAEALHGQVYVAEPGCGGAGQPACTEASAADGELFGLYLEVEGSGLVFKLKGQVLVNPRTGQITTRFVENPQFPFSELSLKLKGGARAPLANPQSCGEARTTSSILPWSAPESGGPSTPFSAFTVTGCGSSMPFAPGFLAGTTSATGGGATGFVLGLSRADGMQDFSGLSVSTPDGFGAVLAGVPRCGEAEADAGSCAAGSRIGGVSAAAGSGSHPFWQSGGVFLTGPYKGAPYGLSIVVPAVAGPFNLGDIVVRAQLRIDPHTEAVTVVSDPFPQIIDGVPLRVQDIDVEINRSGFAYNPTDCASEQQVAGTVTAAQGASVQVASPFAVTGCKTLAFKPVFTASVAGKATKKYGASVDFKLRYPTWSAGTYANTAKFKVSLPLQLSTRDETLHGACVAATFEADPANCPEKSIIGSATASTPVLANPLNGPVYLVGHAGASEPDIEVVLQGEGVEAILDSTTQIKHGITTSTFNSIPDAPVSSFEVKLPTGIDSLLTANLPGKNNYNFCSTTLGALPTIITAQNGALITQNTKLTVTGCPKPQTRAQKLTAALKACHNKHANKRKTCETQAHKKYGATKTTRKT